MDFQYAWVPWQRTTCEKDDARNLQQSVSQEIRPGAEEPIVDFLPHQLELEVERNQRNDLEVARKCDFVVCHKSCHFPSPVQMFAFVTIVEPQIEELEHSS